MRRPIEPQWQVVDRHDLQRSDTRGERCREHLASGRIPRLGVGDELGARVELGDADQPRQRHPGATSGGTDGSGSTLARRWHGNEGLREPTDQHQLGDHGGRISGERCPGHPGSLRVGDDDHRRIEGSQLLVER